MEATVAVHRNSKRLTSDCDRAWEVSRKFFGLVIVQITQDMGVDRVFYTGCSPGNSISISAVCSDRNVTREVKSLADLHTMAVIEFCKCKFVRLQWDVLHFVAGECACGKRRREVCILLWEL
jgi:hypothetical protein